MNENDTIQSLVISANRLGRIAAVSTGDPTPVAHWRTLSILRTDGPMRVGELAAASRVTQPGMTRLLATMVDEEVVDRVADAADSRAWLIRITPKGEAAIEAWHRELGAALTPFFDGLDDDDWRALRRAAEILDTRTRTASTTKALA